MSDFKLTPAREKELEKIAKDLPDKSFKSLYGKDWKSVKIATAMNILKKKYGFKTEETKMKFKELRERVRGGKVDPLSKMGKSKLTGAEISRYYKDNPLAKRAARDATVKKAIELALDLGGSMNYAMKEIEKLKRGLSKNKQVAKALRFANESVAKEAASPEEKAQLALKHAKEKEQLQKKQATEKERMASEGVSVSGERIVNKGKSIIIMIDDNGKKVSAMFKDKKNADKFNRNKPSDVKKLLKLAKSKKYPKAIDENERMASESVVSEGTWAIPDSKNKLALLADMLKKPYPTVNERQLNSFMDKLPVGDDELYDDLDEVMYEKESDGKLKRPLVTLKKWPKVFLNVIAGESLNGRWIKGRTKGNSFIMTHHYFGPDAETESVEEIRKPKRKSGNIRRGKLMKLEND